MGVQLSPFTRAENEPKRTQNAIVGRVPPCSCRLPSQPGIFQMSAQRLGGLQGVVGGCKEGGDGDMGGWMGAEEGGKGRPQPLQLSLSLLWWRQQVGGGGGVGGEESGFVLAPLWLRQEKEFVGLFLFSCLKPREASVPSHGPRAAVGRVTEGLEMSWFTSWATPPGGRDLPALC